MQIVQIPKTESKVEEATLIKWCKREGDKVNQGELIAETETFKAIVEIYSPADGIIYKRFVEEGETVAVNTIIAVIINEGEKVSPEDISPYLLNHEVESEHVKKEKKNSFQRDLNKRIEGRDEKIRIAPVARKLASEKGIDLSLIDGSGPGGAIMKQDIENHISKTSETGERKNFNIGKIYQLTSVQKLSAERLTDSYRNIPQFTLCRKIDIRSLVQRRLALKNMPSIGYPSLIDFIIEALIPTLKIFPEFNAIIDQKGYNFIKEIHFNLAIATERGLMTPVLRNLEGKDVFEIADIRRKMTEKALKGKLQPDNFEQGTFTITNLGLQGIEYFTPIINPPQVVILGIGKSEGTSLPLSMSMDHRLIDGARGADFLEFFAKKLAQVPEGGE